MDVDEFDHDDIYARQLQEVFKSCDLDSKGFLNRNELIDLAQKLQLGDQVSTLLRQLLGNEYADGKVSFEEFREGFVSVLADAIDCLSEVTEDDHSEWSELDAAVNAKESPIEEFDIFSSGENETKQRVGEQEISPAENPSTKRKKRNSVPDKTSTDRRDVPRASSLPSTDSGNVDGDTNEAVQLRQIWDDLGVGESGFITMIQLSEVCEHLGMSELDDDAMEVLFSELDKDRDGLVSFDEFMDGLSTQKRAASTELLLAVERSSSSTPTNNVPEEEKKKKSNSKKTTRTEAGEDKALRNGENVEALQAFSKKSRRKSIDILASLDPMKLGKIKLSDIEELSKSKDFHELQIIIKDLKHDDDGNVQINEFVSQLQRIVSENWVGNFVLKSFHKEMSSLREELDSSNTELATLQATAGKLSVRNKSLVVESEDQLRQCREQHENDLQKQAQLFNENLSQRDQQLMEERDSMLTSHQTENQQLKQRLHEIKADDIKTKTKLKEAAKEIERLEKNLTETVAELTKEKERYTTVRKDAKSVKALKKRIGDLEVQLTTLSDLQTKQKNRTKQLEDSNNILRSQNEDYEIQIKWLKDGGEKAQLAGVQRNGSCLSDYMKPDIVKRSANGESLEEVPRNRETDELRHKILEQDNVIISLRRDLETVNRMLDEKTTTSNERHSRELTRLADKYAGEIADLQLMMSVERNELLQHHSKEKSEIIDNFESKIQDLKNNFVNERDTMINEHKHEKKRLEDQLACGFDMESANTFKRDRRKMEKHFKEEKEELETKHHTEITKLREKIVCLETEKAEMELKFLNEKAELAQRFRLERSDLLQNASNTNREYDRSQKYIDFLKHDLANKHTTAIEELQRDHRNDKHRVKELMENEIKELNSKQQIRVNELTNNFQNQVSEVQKSFEVEQASLKEAFSRDRTEMEQKFAREKKEMKDLLQQDYEHKLALQLAELRKVSVKERSHVEEELRHEKYEICKTWQNDKSSYERKMKKIQTELEISFAEEREKMRGDFEHEKSMMEKKFKREIAELQEAFSMGEASLKGELEDDVHRMLREQKHELAQSYQIEKEQMQFSFNREKSTLKSNWQLEKLSLKENFQTEKNEMEAIFEREKRELTEKFAQQKELFEELYIKEQSNHKEKLSKDIDEIVNRETEQFRANIDELEEEVQLLRDHKKELETRNQVLELKSLSLKQDEIEISEFLKEKNEIKERMSALLEETEYYKNENDALKTEMSETAREKDTILENSVQEITEQQESLSTLQAERECMESKINELLHVASDHSETNEENMRLKGEIAELQRALNSFAEVEYENHHLHDSLKSSQHAACKMEARLQQKIEEACSLNDDVIELQNKVHVLEQAYWQDIDEQKQAYRQDIDEQKQAYRQDIDEQKEALNVQLTAAATEKSRYLRDIQDLKDSLHRANASSNRDNVLKDKVFNDAKQEVMNLNKKLDDKTKKIRALEDSMQQMEIKMVDLDSERKNLDEQVQHWKTVVNENEHKARDQKNNLTSKSIRSDTLVTELYIENAELMKQLASAETHQMKAEKQMRQLTDQKRALQRVISKLCNSYGITNIP